MYIKLFALYNGLNHTLLKIITFQVYRKPPITLSKIIFSLIINKYTILFKKLLRTFNTRIYNWFRKLAMDYIK